MTLTALARRLLGRFVPRTPEIQEWEWYARDHVRNRSRSSQPLGAEWNTPERIGIDAPPEAVAERIAADVILPHLAHSSSVLEIGAGGGRFTRILARHFPRVIAADTSPTMIELLRREFAGNSGVATMLLNGTDLSPIADASIDAVVTYDVFVHLPAWEIFNYLVEIRRVLVPGGRAVVHHSSTFTDLGWQKFLEDARRTALRQRPRGRFTLMTPDAMRELVTRSGLRVESMVVDVVRRDCIARIDRPS